LQQPQPLPQAFDRRIRRPYNPFHLGGAYTLEPLQKHSIISDYTCIATQNAHINTRTCEFIPLPTIRKLINLGINCVPLRLGEGHQILGILNRNERIATQEAIKYLGVDDLCRACGHKRAVKHVSEFLFVEDGFEIADHREYLRTYIHTHIFMRDQIRISGSFGRTEPNVLC
jgi:hypothetical protein